MTLSELTGWMMIVYAVMMIGWDIYVKLKQPDGNATISWVLLTAAKKFPIIAVALGILFGHLFWPQGC